MRFMERLAEDGVCWHDDWYASTPYSDEDEVRKFYGVLRDY
jgi:hypothetical protein